MDKSMLTKPSKKDLKKTNYQNSAFFSGNFNENLNSIFRRFDVLNPSHGQSLKLGFILCIGSFINKYHTIIIRGRSLVNRTETIDNILSPISPSLVCSLYGITKEELLKIKPSHKILHVENFKKCVELITLLIKANQEGIFYKNIKIPKLTVITDAFYEEIPTELGDNSIIIESSDNNKYSKSNYNKPLTYAEKILHQNSLDRENESNILFINALNTQIQVEISTIDSINNKINNLFPNHTYYYKVLLDLIEIITFLNQDKRKCYQVLKKEEDIEKRVVISNIEDVKWCFDTVKRVFTKNHFDMPNRYLELLNYIIGWLTQDSVIKELKEDKKIPENWDDYFVGMALINDYIKFLEFHPEKKTFVRDKRRFREYLLHLSDHKVKGKFGCLHFCQEENKNKYKLINAPMIKLFDFDNEYDEFIKEHLNFLQYLEENSFDLSIELNFER
jgi:hypothetical protein